MYEYASFTQSKMYAAGVTCSDCHNAHSLKQRGTGNNVCGHCHLPLTYDTPAHHHHKQGTEAARCRNCHMRTTTYMVVDPRYDHSMRVPRVDYSIRYGIPNACTTPCHTDKSLTWANDAVVKWYGPTRTRGNDYVAALDAARKAAAGRGTRAARRRARRRRSRAIARATALQHLRDVCVPASIEALQAGVTDPDAIVRAAAARALEALPPPDRVRLGRPLLDGSGPARARVGRARRWPARRRTCSPRRKPPISSARRARRSPWSWRWPSGRRRTSTSATSTCARAGSRDAEDALMTALRLDPRNIPARVNLADLYRGAGREADAERLLTEALGIDPSVAEARHALGLLYIRVNRRGEAMAHLKRAHELLPRMPATATCMPSALDDAGRTGEAIRMLRGSSARTPPIVTCSWLWRPSSRSRATGATRSGGPRSSYASGRTTRKRAR